MKDHTTAEIFEELWKRIEYDANVSEELASESNELQERIDKVIECLEEGIDFPYYDEDTKKYLKGMKDILEGSDKSE